eukprot:5518335-Pleurochrysis_carterae.AAC.1
MQERADKLHYYSWRKKVRKLAASCNSLIIDKMDGNKNKVRSFVLPVKDCGEKLRDTMKFHVAGVIIHAR